MNDSYPGVLDPTLVGTYSPVAKAGGGYVWNDVLECRVWCHPERGAPDLEDGNDYYHAFATYAEALHFPKAPWALKNRLRSFVSSSTSRNPILATIVTLRKCVSPNGP